MQITKILFASKSRYWSAMVYFCIIFILKGADAGSNLQNYCAYWITYKEITIE